MIAMATPSTQDDVSRHSTAASYDRCIDKYHISYFIFLSLLFIDNFTTTVQLYNSN